MARRSRYLALTANSYKQFAAATLVLVGLLTVFLGDNREIEGSAPAARPATQVLLTKGGNQRMRPLPRAATTFSDETASSGGDETWSAVEPDSTIGDYAPQNSAKPSFAELAQMGVGSSQFASRAPEQQAEMLARARSGAEMATSERIDDLIAASAARSGGTQDPDL